jgi:hypothetical protein
VHVAGVEAVVEVAVENEQFLRSNYRACRGVGSSCLRAEAFNLFEPCYQASYLVRKYWHLSTAPQTSQWAAKHEEAWTLVCIWVRGDPVTTRVANGWVVLRTDVGYRPRVSCILARS